MRVPKFVNYLWHSESWYQYVFDVKRSDVICKHRLLGVKVFVMLVAVLLMPNVAYADDGLGSSFTNGLNTLLGNPEVSTNDGNDFQRDYEPNEITLDSPAVRALPENATTYDYIMNWFENLRVSYDGGNRRPQNWHVMLRIFLINVVVPVAVVFVFLWWGVRKSIRMLFAAFRKGSANV